MSVANLTRTAINRMALLLPGSDPKSVIAASNATTTSVVAAAGTSFGKTSATAFNGRWASVVYDAGGAAAAPEGESKIITAYASVTFTVPAFSAAVTAGDIVIVTPCSLTDMYDALNDVLRTLPLPRYLAVGLVVGGDEPTTAAWTDVAGGSGAQVQTLENTEVLTGAQSVKLETTTLSDAFTSAAIPVSSGEQLIVYGALKVPTGSMRIQLWDSTNSVELAGAETDEQNWSRFEFTVSIPSTCENVTIRVKSTTATTTAYLDHAQILIPSRGYLDLPSRITNPSRFTGLFTVHGGQSSTGTNTWAWHGDMGAVPHSGTMRDLMGVNSNRVNIEHWQHPLYMEFTQMNTAVSTMSATFYGDADALEGICELAVAGCYKRLANNSADQTQKLNLMGDAFTHTRIGRNLLRSIDIGVPESTSLPQKRVAARSRY